MLAFPLPACLKNIKWMPQNKLQLVFVELRQPRITLKPVNKADNVRSKGKKANPTSCLGRHRVKWDYYRELLCLAVCDRAGEDRWVPAGQVQRWWRAIQGQDHRRGQRAHCPRGQNEPGLHDEAEGTYLGTITTICHRSTPHLGQLHICFGFKYFSMLNWTCLVQLSQPRGLVGGVYTFWEFLIGSVYTRLAQ